LKSLIEGKYVLHHPAIEYVAGSVVTIGIVYNL